MRLMLTLCAALALAACSGETRKETGGKAGGEILPASVGDAMLPYDTVRSQAPLAPKAGSSEAGKDKPDARPAGKVEAEAAPEPASRESTEPADAE
jgi:hypothetical protein